jgi:hypothetical protein
MAVIGIPVRTRRTAGLSRPTDLGCPGRDSTDADANASERRSKTVVTLRRFAGRVRRGADRSSALFHGYAPRAAGREAEPRRRALRSPILKEK